MKDLTSQFRDFQKRAIVFHSEPLAHDMEVAGHMRLRLVTEANAPDFDLWAQVLMVMPDGSRSGWARTSGGRGSGTGPFTEELLKPGQIAGIPFEFYWMARRIPAGARIASRSRRSTHRVSEELQHRWADWL